MKLNDLSVRAGMAASVALAAVLLIPNPAQGGNGAEEAPIADPAPAPIAVAKPHPANVDALTLIGTASSPSSDYAFFDSNRPEWRRLVHRGEKIGNCVVESIAAESIVLKEGAREIVLPIHEQIQREEQGQWQLAAVEKRMEWPDDSPAPVPAPAPAVTASKPVKMMAAPAPAASDKELRKLDKVALESFKPAKSPKDFMRSAESRVMKTIAKEFKRLK